MTHKDVTVTFILFLTLFSAFLYDTCKAGTVNFVTSKIEADIDSDTGIISSLRLRDDRFDNKYLLIPEVIERFSDSVQPLGLVFRRANVEGELREGRTTIQPESGQTLLRTVYRVSFDGKEYLEVERRKTFYDHTYIFDFELKISNISSESFGPFNVVLDTGPGLTDNTFENEGIFKIEHMVKRMPFRKRYEPRVYNEPMDVCGIKSVYHAMIVSVESGVEQYGFTFERLEAEANEEDAAISGGAGRLNMHINKIIPPRDRLDISMRVLLGPMFSEELESINATGLVNLGFFSGIASFLLHILTLMKSFTGSWGLSIILLTVLVRGVLHPLNVKQMKSMKEMQKIQPIVNELREKYKNDSQKLNTEMMQLYKEHNVNPLSGCLPMFFQLPILFALFSVLRSNVELKGVPFLWIKDLAMPEIIMFGGNEYDFPLLALLVAISMWWQQKTMGHASPEQQNMMWMMPIVMFMISRNFAAGLLLYWFVSNLLSAITQKYAHIRMEPAAEILPADSGKNRQARRRKKGE